MNVANLYLHRLAKQDPYNPEVLALHTRCLTECREDTELFIFAHNLSNRLPESSVAWYAIGSYYFLKSNYTEARKCLAYFTILHDF